MWTVLSAHTSHRCFVGRKTPASLCRHVTQSTRKVNFQELDVKWQRKWNACNASRKDGSQPKSYVLPMFAYPSGSLHMGHLRVYTISDVLARYRRLRGEHVLHPTGWDAFGLPAENAAIERGIDPAEWTVANIEKMKQQLKSMNTHFDWDAEISTCSPEFYKHTQKLFLMLHARGLAYQAEAMVNWDPVDKTVLANEQVDGNGRSWRSGAVVEQKMLRQWFFKITEFQEELLQDLDHLARDHSWPDRVIAQQRNWIGKSKGARITFSIESKISQGQEVNVFTTRPDTLFGVKYIALSFSHPLVQQMATFVPELKEFLKNKTSFASDSKDGFKLPITATNPLSVLGLSDTPPVPVYVAPYVLENYGEGAVMGVPGHDSRDLSFWKRHAPFDQVPIVVQARAEISLPGQTTRSDLCPLVSHVAEAYTEAGILTELCGPYAGFDSDAGAEAIVTALQARRLAKPINNWRLRDWLVSRQRYWGTPIPIVHCAKCGTVPVPEEDLPVELPRLTAAAKGQTGNPLEKCEDWLRVACPSCGGTGRRETDTMDTFVDSSWYYMRFPDPKNQSRMFSMKSTEMLPVSTYIGGVEHAILHLLYARFVYKFLCREGMVNGVSQPHEPFTKLIAQGMVHGKTFSDPDSGRFLLPAEVDLSGDEPAMVSTGGRPTVSWEKMSKSKHNGVDPSTCITKYGADATRSHILFAAPVSEVLQWDEEKIVGIQRWFQRIERIVADCLAINPVRCGLEIESISDADAEILLLSQRTLEQITGTLETNPYGLNTYVSDLIKLTNTVYNRGIAQISPATAVTSVSALIHLLAPIAPAFAEECWESLQLKHNSTQSCVSIFDSHWPNTIINTREKLSLQSRAKTQVCAVQINGKLKFTTEVPLPSSSRLHGDQLDQHEQKVIDAVLSTEDGRIWLTERNDWSRKKKVVVVRGGKLLNIVF